MNVALVNLHWQSGVACQCTGQLERPPPPSQRRPPAIGEGGGLLGLRHAPGRRRPPGPNKLGVGGWGKETGGNKEARDRSYTIRQLENVRAYESLDRNVLTTKSMQTEIAWQRQIRVYLHGKVDCPTSGIF